MSQSALQVYGTQQVMTSSPAKLIVLLYDKAIISLREAVQAIADGQVEKRWKANSKAVDIITHLANTLDHDNGGEIAENLSQLYEFMLGQLMNVDVKNDAKAANDVIALLLPLRESWQQIAGDPQAKAAGAAESAPTKTVTKPAYSPVAPAPSKSSTGSDSADIDRPSRQAVNLSA